VRRSGYLDRWNVDEGGGEKDNGSRHVAEAMTRHGFEGSRQGASTRTTGADKDTRQGIELAGIVSVSPIPPFASSFTVNDCGHLTPSSSNQVISIRSYPILSNSIRFRRRPPTELSPLLLLLRP